MRGQAGEAEDFLDNDRFYCPYPGCNRSFAELWRLKVHYRAPPDVRGSGKERGHGTELTHCPKCLKALRPGKHHVDCSAKKAAGPRGAPAKRQKKDEDAEEQQSDNQDDMLVTTSSAQGGDAEAVLQGSTGPSTSSQPGAARAAAAAGAAGPSTARPSGRPQRRQPKPQPRPAPLGPPDHDDGSTALPSPLHSGIFDYSEDAEPAMPPRVPSPPPLPADWHMTLDDRAGAMMPQQQPHHVGAGLLFNFAQFSERMPPRRPQQPGDNPFQWAAGDITFPDDGLDMTFDQHNSEDLMSLLLGAPNEYPSLATTHLHSKQARNPPAQPAAAPASAAVASTSSGQSGSAGSAPGVVPVAPGPPPPLPVPYILERTHTADDELLLLGGPPAPMLAVPLAHMARHPSAADDAGVPSLSAHHPLDELLAPASQPVPVIKQEVPLKHEPGLLPLHPLHHPSHHHLGGGPLHLGVGSSGGGGPGRPLGPGSMPPRKGTDAELLDGTVDPTLLLVQMPCP